MTFFYDLNKKLDGIRATPEVKTQQLNEQAGPLTQILNERATGDYSAVKAAAGKDIGKPGKNFSKIAAGAAKRYGSEEAGKRVAGAVLNKLRHPKEGMAEGSGESVSFGEMVNVVDEHYPKYYAELSVSEISDEQFKHEIISTYNKIIKKERMRNDFNARMERESVGMDEAAKYRDPKYKDKLYTQEPGDHDDYDNDMMDVDWNDYGPKMRPKNDPGAKRRMGGVGDKSDRTDPLVKGFGRSGVGRAVEKGPRKGLPVRDQIRSLKGSIKDALGTHAEPNLPEGEGGIPMTPKQKSFAKLAPPVDKITFADKIVGAKKEVDEVLGDVAAQAMRKAVGRHDQDMEEASTGNAFDWKNRKEPEVQKPASRIHKGTYGTEYDGDKDDAKALATKKRAAADAGQAQRGRGRPKNNASADTGEVMKPDWSAFEKKVKVKPHTGKITKHKMVGEDDLDPEDQGEYDQEGAAAKDDIKTVLRHAQALQKVLGDNDNLPEWVQAKLSKIEGMMTAVDDYMQNQAGDDMDGEEEPIDERSVSKAQVKTMGAAAHNPKFAKKVGIKPSVAKEFNQADKGKDNSKLPEKAPKKKKEVDETTTSGSMATSGGAPKSSGGMSYGKGIYDSLNREVEGMISESMNISMNMSNDSHGGPNRSLTVTATDEDATALASMLRMAGMGGGNDHMPHMNNGVVQPDEIKVIDFDDGTDDLAAELSNELHGGHDSHDSEVCPECGSSDCGCGDEESVDEAYGDTDETLNSPDWPTDAEGTEDAMMYSGGLNRPKATGQTTVPVIASQEDRQHAYEDAAALRRMMEMAGLPVAEAAPPVKLATPQAIDDPVSPAPAAAAPGKKPVVKPVTKSATPQAIDDPVAPVKEDKMAQSLMRELHNFKY